MVYLVSAEYGEWDDYLQWNVAIFKEEKDAKDFVEMANEWVQKRGYREDCPFDPQNRWGAYPPSQYSYYGYTVR